MLTTKKWVTLLPAFIVATLEVVLLAGCTPPGPRALLQGERLIREGRYDQAIERLSAATRLLPQNAQAWNYLGLAYHRAGQFAPAAQAYQQALARDRDLVAARFNLGCLYAEQNNLGAAIPELTTYTLHQPNAIDGWLQLGLAQLRAHQFAAAENSFNRARQLDPRNPVALNGLGLIQFQRNRPREASNYFGAALQAQPHYGPALLNLAIVSDRYLRNHSSALKTYREYLALTPRPPNWAEVDQIARELAMELTPPPPRPTPSHTVVQLAAATNVAPPPPTHSAPLTTAAPAPAVTNRPVTVAQMASPPPETPANLVGKEPPKESRLQPASPPKQTVPPQPEPPVAVEIVRLPGEPLIKPPTEAEPQPQAQPATETQAPPTAAASDTFNPPSRVTPPPEKPGIFQRLNPRTWFRRKPRATAAETEPSPAAIKPNPPVAASPQPPPVAPTPAPPPARYAYHSPARPAAGDRAEAQRYFAQGAAAQRDGTLTLAMEAYQKAADLDPAFFEAQYNLGLAAYESGKAALSLSAYETALAIKADSIDARYNFALALQQANYPVDAASELTKILVERPNEARAHLTLANLYAQQLSWPRLARSHYLRVLELEPQHPQATAIRSWLAGNPP